MSLVLGGVLVPGMNAMSVYAEGSAMGKGPVVLWMPRCVWGGGCCSVQFCGCPGGCPGGGVAQRGRGSAAREAQRGSCSSSSLPGGGTAPLIPCLHPLCSELFTAIQHFSREERLSTYQQVDM